MVRFVAHHDVFSRQADLDPDHRRYGAVTVLGALIDAYSASDETIVDLLELRDPATNFLFGPIGTVDIVEGNFHRNLHGITVVRNRSRCNAPQATLVSARRKT